MSINEPVGDILRLRVLGHGPKTIKKHLDDQGITMSERRIKKVYNSLGDDAVSWIREEYMDEAARTILDYRKQITEMAEWFNKRFVEAQEQYDIYQESRGLELEDLLQDYKHDPNPDIADYRKRIQAKMHGMDLMKLTKVMKSLSSELNDWAEMAAKMDKRMTQDTTVNLNQINFESQVTEIYESLCSNCQNELANL